jgi:hypothetical protein
MVDLSVSTDGGESSYFEAPEIKSSQVTPIVTCSSPVYFSQDEVGKKRKISREVTAASSEKEKELRLFWLFDSYKF